MIVAARSGVAAITLYPRYSGSGDDGSNYYIVTILLNGASGRFASIDTRTGNLVGHKGYAMGTATVAKGDTITVSVTKTGSPDVAFAEASFSVLAEITPRQKPT